MSAILTLALPYYLQDQKAPILHLFQQLGWIEVKWIVSVGAISALCTNLLGGIFPLPRVLYAMASDGIIFKSLKQIHPKTHTPFLATILSGIFVGFMAMIFNLKQLVDMMSIGTLLAYTIIAICVLILRYQDPNRPKSPSQPTTLFQILEQIFNLNKSTSPDYLSATISKVAISIYSLLALILCSTLKFGDFTKAPAIIVTCIVIIAMVILVVMIARQPIDNVQLTFKVPWVPFSPCLSVFINLYLMFQLDARTWIRFAAWMLIGKIFEFKNRSTFNILFVLLKQGT